MRGGGTRCLRAAPKTRVGASIPARATLTIVEICLRLWVAQRFSAATNQSQEKGGFSRRGGSQHYAGTSFLSDSLRTLPTTNLISS
jgi:hypothetical protein